MIRIIAPLLILILAGCGGANVVVEGDFPKPLVEPLPLHMGVYYSKKFRQYTHQEKEDKKSPEHSITTGATQVKLFNRLFDAAFLNTTELAKLPTPEKPSAVNAILAPEVDELQFTFPRDTRSKVFEVWIKYRMNLYAPDGALIMDWPVSAYGKTPIAFMKSRDQALKQAALVALRDAGAHFVISLRRLPKLQRWLDREIDVPIEADAEEKSLSAKLVAE